MQSKAYCLILLKLMIHILHENVFDNQSIKNLRMHCTAENTIAICKSCKQLVACITNWTNAFVFGFSGLPFFDIYWFCDSFSNCMIIAYPNRSCFDPSASTILVCQWLVAKAQVIHFQCFTLRLKAGKGNVR